MPRQHVNDIGLYYELTGDDSIVHALASTACRHAGRHTFAGADHMLHLSDPERYSTTAQSFASTTRALHVAGSR